ncbi:AHH domain-containing protein, partial [Desmospora profundinema]|uniref:AHH domain-containing protein n=1 Tax=Desmospora profundinema TaxID=1571184 RepID=UPI00286D1CD0
SGPTVLALSHVVYSSYSHLNIYRNIFEIGSKSCWCPPYPNAAHHIVPWDDPRAVPAQRILREYGIETESAVNGVFLPYKGSKYVGDEALHRGNHGESYVRKVM